MLRSCNILGKTGRGNPSHNAFRITLSGKKGPVLLDIPRDLIDGKTVRADTRQPGAYRPVDNRIQWDANAVQQAVAMLAQARRPLLLAGAGIID